MAELWIISLYLPCHFYDEIFVNNRKCLFLVKSPNYAKNIQGTVQLVATGCLSVYLFGCVVILVGTGAAHFLKQEPSCIFPSLPPVGGIVIIAGMRGMMILGQIMAAAFFVGAKAFLCILGCGRVLVKGAKITSDVGKTMSYVGKITSDVGKIISDLFSPTCNILKNKPLRGKFSGGYSLANQHITILNRNCGIAGEFAVPNIFSRHLKPVTQIGAASM